MDTQLVVLSIRPDGLAMMVEEIVGHMISLRHEIVPGEPFVEDVCQHVRSGPEKWYIITEEAYMEAMKHPSFWQTKVHACKHDFMLHVDAKWGFLEVLPDSPVAVCFNLVLRPVANTFVKKLQVVTEIP